MFFLTLKIIKIQILTLRLNKTDREKFRRRVNILIPQMEKSEIVNRFQNEGYPRRTIYDTINCMQIGGTITQPPGNKNQLKRLPNNRKGFSQRRHGRKLGVSV